MVISFRLSLVLSVRWLGQRDALVQRLSSQQANEKIVCSLALKPIQEGNQPRSRIQSQPEAPLRDD